MCWVGFQLWGSFIPDDVVLEFNALCRRFGIIQFLMLFVAVLSLRLQFPSPLNTGLLNTSLTQSFLPHLGRKLLKQSFLTLLLKLMVSQHPLIFCQRVPLVPSAVTWSETGSTEREQKNPAGIEHLRGT